jgi:plastocyanin
MHRAVPYLALLVVAILTGCGGGNGGGDDGTSEAGGAPSASLSVSATDFAFTPAELTAEAGTVSIELVNDGDAPHAIEIEGNGVEESSETIDAGETTTLTVELEDGTYEVYCPVDGHRDLGMVGTLTVGAGGATTDDEATTDEDAMTDEDTTTDDDGVGTDTDESSDGSARY